MVAPQKDGLLEQNRRDFDFRDEHFAHIRKLVRESSGIMLSEVKKDMVYGRLVRRLRTLNISNFDEYLKLLSKKGSSEITEFTNAITTNLTAFFRESHHFDYLASTILPELKRVNSNRRIRIWSAGCSTGEEPYCLAMTIKESKLNFSGWDIQILATDLDTNVVETASQGVYASEKLKGVSNSRRHKWFQKGQGEQSGYAKVKPALQNLITFKQLNLMDRWPMKGPFDLIICRNVVIYFNKDTQRTLFDRYADLIAPGGHMVVGHSESLHGVTNRFDLLGKTIYRKKN